jgi:predicted DNA-binding transcriptional regulator YafY
VIEKRTLRIRYRTGSTGALSTRELDPYRVWYRSGGLYVVGFDHKSEEIRTFAVDRIQQATATSRRFEPDPSFDFEATMASSFGVIAETPVQVRIRFERRWAGYVEERVWHSSQVLTPLADGRTLLTMTVGGTADLRTGILSFGSGAEVLEPEALRAEVTKELGEALERYGRVRPAASPRARARTARA